MAFYGKVRLSQGCFVGKYRWVCKPFLVRDGSSNAAVKYVATDYGKILRMKIVSGFSPDRFLSLLGIF